MRRRNKEENETGNESVGDAMDGYTQQLGVARSRNVLELLALSQSRSGERY
jgi:hypothetical protein